MDAKKSNESPNLILGGRGVLGGSFGAFGTVYAGASASSTFDSADSITDCNLTDASG
jgi:hypothetical protein